MKNIALIKHKTSTKTKQKIKPKMTTNSKLMEYLFFGMVVASDEVVAFTKDNWISTSSNRIH